MFFLIPFAIYFLSSVVILFSVTWFSLFFQLFPLLLDYLTFGFWYFPLLHLIDDKSSILGRAIVWDAILLGDNKKGGKLSGGNYVKAIYLGSIIQGQFSRWQLLESNYQWSIILREIVLGQFFRVQLSGGQLSWGTIVQGTIILGDNLLVPYLDRWWFTVSLFIG